MRCVWRHWVLVLLSQDYSHLGGRYQGVTSSFATSHCIAVEFPSANRRIVIPVLRTGPFDLHALSTPPTFILDQDQILKKNKLGQLKNFFVVYLIGKDQSLLFANKVYWKGGGFVNLMFLRNTLSLLQSCLKASLPFPLRRPRIRKKSSSTSLLFGDN